MPGGQVFGFEHGGSRRYAELINRLFQMESADAPMPPGFIIEEDRPEWRIHKRELNWTTGPVTIAGNVGNFSRVQIHNPTGSDRIVIVEGFAVVAAVIGQYFITMDGALAGVPTANFALDSRAPVQAGVRKVASLNRIDNTLPAASGTKVDQQSATVAGQNLSFNYRLGPMQPIILRPNTVTEIVCAIANTALTALVYGYERPATPDELAQ